MSACQLGKGRNCREGVPHTQGNWRIFEQPEIFRMCQPLFAGTPANRPIQAEDQRLA